MVSLRDSDRGNALPSVPLPAQSGERPAPLIGKSLKAALGYGILFATFLFASQFAVGRFGVPFLLIALIGILIGLLYSIVSWRYLIVPFMVIILAVGGFRFLWAVKAPGLPDMFLDRMALVWLVIVFGIKSVATRKALRPPFLLDTLIVVNLFYLFMSIMVNDYLFFNLWTKSYFVPYVCYFLAKNIMTTQRAMRTLLIGLAILNVYYSVTSIAEKFEIMQLIWPKAMLYEETVWHNRSNGPFAHAPLFGTVMGMILPIYVYLIATTRNRLVQVLCYIALALGFAGLYFTYTRGSWLAGIMALIVAIVLNRKGHYLRISLPAMILVPLIAVYLLGAGNDKVMKKRVENEQTMSSRMGVAVTALRMWRQNPIFGVGFFQFRFVREDYVDAVEVPIFGTVRYSYFRHTSIHDIYLGPLAETGLVGALLQFFIYLLIFKAFLKHFQNRRGPPHFRTYLLPIFGGMCVGYLMGGLAIDYRFFSMVGTMFYSVAGMVYGYTGDDEVSEETGGLLEERISSEST